MPMLNLLLPNASMDILHIVFLSPRLVSLGVIGLIINGSELQDGVHHAKRGKTHTAKALKHMKTQDLNYVSSKRSMEAKVNEYKT